MKRLGFVLLLLASASAEAEWTLVDSNNEAYVYADFAPIRKRGDFVTVWFLYDLTAARRLANGDESLSAKFQQEYDCGKERRFRKIFSSFHSENMGTGDIVGIDPSIGEWVPVSPGTASERYWKRVCAR